MKCKFCPVARYKDAICTFESFNGNTRYCEKADPEHPKFSSENIDTICKLSNIQPVISIGLIYEGDISNDEYIGAAIKNLDKTRFVFSAIPDPNDFDSAEYDIILVRNSARPEQYVNSPNLNKFIFVTDTPATHIGKYMGIVLSDASQRKLFENHYHNRITVIPKSVKLPNPSRDRMKLRERLGIDPNKVVLGYVGSITDSVREILDAANLTGAMVILVGDGPDREAIDLYADILNIPLYWGEPSDIVVCDIYIDPVNSYEDENKLFCVANYIPVITPPGDDEVFVGGKTKEDYINFINRDKESRNKAAISAHMYYFTSRNDKAFVEKWVEYLESVYKTKYRHVTDGPSIFVKINNFSRAIFNFTGFADGDIQRNRMKICESCPHFLDDKTCELCGCYLPAKTAVASEECPAKPPKWVKQSITSIGSNGLTKTPGKGGCGCKG
jgi:hypothetical protein